jgi:hypothetical protein
VSALGVTRKELLNLLLVDFSALGPNAYRIFSGVKLNRIEVRVPSAASDVTSTDISVEWTSTYGPSSEVSDSGTPLHPPLLVTSPPPQSLASFWSLTGSNETDVLMILTAPVSAIIDVWVDVILQDGQTPVLVTTGNFLAPGTVVAFYLDGPSGVIQPVGYTNHN